MQHRQCHVIRQQRFGISRRGNKERVARKGGEAQHDERGLQAADQETRERVARAGGEASGGGSSSNQGQGARSVEGRGFAGMSEEERKRIASKGGQQ